MRAGLKASRMLPEVAQAHYVPERRALRLDLADGVAVELPLDSVPEFQHLSDRQRAAIQVLPHDHVYHEETDVDLQLSGWLASQPQLARLAQSITAWRQATRIHHRPFPVRANDMGKGTWERMSDRFKRRLRTVLRDPQVGVALSAPNEGYLFTDPVSGSKIWFRRDSEQVTILGVMTPSELARFHGKSTSDHPA
jgi:hypothetical protein